MESKFLSLVLVVLVSVCAIGQESNKPDNSMAGLQKHKESWPAEVVLTEATEFPVVINGQPAGSALVPAGTKVKLIRIEQEDVIVAYQAGTKRLTAKSTDLLRPVPNALAETIGAPPLAEQSHSAGVARPPTETIIEPLDWAMVKRNHNFGYTDEKSKNISTSHCELIWIARG